MADEGRTDQGQPEAARRSTLLTDQLAELFDELGQRAEDVARTVEHSVEVYERLPAHLLSCPDHVERERMLTAAKYVAAEAYRAHRVPPTEVRAAVRRAGDISRPGPAGGRSSSGRKDESSPDA